MIFGIFFGLYSFRPYMWKDEPHCYYGIEDFGQVYTEPYPPSIVFPYIDVADKLRIFFKIGFSICCIFTSYSMFGLLYMIFKNPMLVKAAMLSIFVTILSTIGWMVFGSFLYYMDST